MPFAQPPDPPAIVVIAKSVRDSISAIWLRNNVHWDQLTDQNTLTQMLGTGKPTQREYLGCLIGHVVGETVYVTAWMPSEHMHQWQFAVTGDCTHINKLVGTWHTHPYRADSANHALKEPVLSATDLSTFASGSDRVVIAAWDADSIDVAVRASDGSVQHPAHVIASP
jgi:proteasome lid subunit RPN8/RPN11